MYFTYFHNYAPSKPSKIGYFRMIIDIFFGKKKNKLGLSCAKWKKWMELINFLFFGGWFKKWVQAKGKENSGKMESIE